MRSALLFLGTVAAVLLASLPARACPYNQQAVAVVQTQVVATPVVVAQPVVTAQVVATPAVVAVPLVQSQVVVTPFVQTFAVHGGYGFNAVNVRNVRRGNGNRGGSGVVGIVGAAARTVGNLARDVVGGR